MNRDLRREHDATSALCWGLVAFLLALFPAGAITSLAFAQVRDSGVSTINGAIPPGRATTAARVETLLETADGQEAPSPSFASPD